MRKPTPVTTSSMTSESWSRTRLKSTWKAADGDPGTGQGFDERQRHGRDQTAARTACGSGNAGGDEGVQNQKRTSPAARAMPMVVTSHLGRREPRIPLSRNPAKGSSGISQRWRDLVHSFIRSMRSTDSVARARKTAMMMARPTAASAAATIMTKKTKICPLTACH